MQGACFAGCLLCGVPVMRGCLLCDLPVMLGACYVRVAKIYDWIKETVKANAGDAKEMLLNCHAFFTAQTKILLFMPLQYK